MRFKPVGVIILLMVGLVAAYSPPVYNAVNLVLEGGYNPPAYNAIQLILGGAAAPSDPCEAPASGNFTINSTDNCQINDTTIDLTPDGILFTDDGSITFRRCTLLVGFFERVPGDGGTNTVITAFNTNTTIK